MHYQYGWTAMDHKAFISAKKSLLIAPAGHGKTHAITDCLAHTEGKRLILTHTHAGIASIREKIKKANISSRKYHIETITGYAQKYVQAFYTGSDMPDRHDINAYYSFLVAKATALLKTPLIAKTIAATYSGLFVDEYQDCTLEQHALVATLNDILPTQILGDPLQRIFGFKGTSMVDLESSSHMGDFLLEQHYLEEPWRWKGKNENLGQALKEIRNKIISKEPIDLREFPAIEVFTVSNAVELYNPRKPYYQAVSRLLSEKNVLLIHPLSANSSARLKIISLFKQPIILVEAIDDKDFYKGAALFDSATIATIEKLLIDTCLDLFNKTGIKVWFSERGLIRKTKPDERIISDQIKIRLDELKSNYSFTKAAKFLKFIDSLNTIRCYRREMLNALCASLVAAQANGNSVNESMVESRNHFRRVGRKVYGRCIGTTLLTKGLEFDTVIILNAQDFSCPKNLYVALTRASKRLVVFTSKPVLSPTY